MFGRKMNAFKDWKSNNKDETAAIELLERAKEIKQLVEHVHTEAQQVIKDKQVKQKKTQNNAHNITNEPLKIGSKVYIKSLKIQGKLKPKYHGEYTIVGKTNNGNYLLENHLGVRLSQSYPLSQLKAVDKDETDDHYEVEKILDHKIWRGKIEYFVKWKGYPDSECSWVKEKDFDTTEIIEEYWGEQTAPAEILYSNTHISNRRSSTTMHLTKWIYFILFCCFIKTGYGQPVDQVILNFAIPTISHH